MTSIRNSDLDLLEDPVGVVLNIPDDFTIQFVSSHVKKNKIGSIIGVLAGDDRELWVLGEINKLNSRYYIRDSENYLLGRIVKNELAQLMGNEVERSIGVEAQARILGFYKRIENRFEALPGFPNRYTSYPLQAVYLIDISKVKCVYGLSEKGFSIGEMRFPENQPTIVSAESFFQNHSLICGMTGAGKTRLAALLAIGLGARGANVIIIDPHDEYEAILAKNGQGLGITKFSRSYRRIEKVQIGGNEVFHKPFQFKMSSLTPSVLIELLPMVSPQQADLIYRAYRIAATSPGVITPSKLLITLNKMLESVGKEQRVKAEGLERVYAALIRKIGDASREDQGYLGSETPAWTEVKRNNISILCGERADRLTGRFISAVLQHVLTRQARAPKILLIEECHQLFETDSDEEMRSGRLLGQLLREARKYGTGLILVTQVENDIPMAVRDQIQNRFHFRDVRNEKFINLSDRLCRVILHGSQTGFLMWVNDIE